MKQIELLNSKKNRSFSKIEQNQKTITPTTNPNTSPHSPLPFSKYLDSRSERVSGRKNPNPGLVYSLRSCKCGIPNSRVNSFLYIFLCLIQIQWAIRRFHWVSIARRLPRNKWHAACADDCFTLNHCAINHTLDTRNCVFILYLRTARRCWNYVNYLDACATDEMTLKQLTSPAPHTLSKPQASRMVVVNSFSNQPGLFRARSYFFLQYYGFSATTREELIDLVLREL
jgi:hypothetical protein